MAEKLVPGIPHSTRIAILQQTEEEAGEDSTGNIDTGLTVLEQVMSSDSSRNEVTRKMERMSKHLPYDQFYLT